MTQRVYWAGLLVFFTAAMAMAQKPLTEWFQEPVKQLSPEQLFERQAQMFDRDVKSQVLLKTKKQARWWGNPQTAEMLGLTTDQVKRMDDIFQQHRLKLIDLNASLDREETILEPLMGADQPDDNKVMAQIDRVAQARAELEKANSRMLWSIRRVLTPDQWKKLQSEPTKPIPGPPIKRY
jgi:Spy/CpxP family protein refolding chaperone